jgi:hypothetical protein
LTDQDAAERNKAGRDANVAQVKPALTTIKTRRPLCGGLVFQSPEPAKEQKPKRAKKAKIKNDPKFVAAERELRDRWLERVNASPLIAEGKYDVARQLPPAPAPPAPVARAARAMSGKQMSLLNAA